MIPSNYADYAVTRESGGNPFAKNPRSSATGKHQFIDSTWERYVRTRPDLNLTMDGRTDPEQSQRAFDAFTADNADTLKRNGVPINNQTLYLAHHFGAGGALKALSADPNTPVSSIFGADVIKANPHLANKRVADITGTGSKQMDYTSRPALSTGAQLGSGVLFPGTREEAAAPSNWDNALIGAGSALAGISSPQQAAALAGLMRTNGSTGDNFSTTYNEKTGAIYRVNKKTGRVEMVRDPNARPEATEYDKAYDKQEAEANVKFNSQLQTDAQKAGASLSTVQQMRALLENPNVSQGFGAEQKLLAKKIGSQLGYSFEGVPEAETAKALANQITLSLRSMGEGMPGSLSDNDLKFLREANVSLGNDPATNQKLLNIFEKAHTRTIEADQLRAQYVKERGRLDSGFRDLLTQKWAAENKAADAAEAPKPAAPVVRWGRDKNGNPTRM